VTNLAILGGEFEQGLLEWGRSPTCPIGAPKPVRYTEVSRGCRHRRRHCSVTPVYNGRLRSVLHTEFPSLTYDVTTQIEHLRRHRALLPRLRTTGCPAGARLLELPDIRELIAGFDEAALAYAWKHPDPSLDQLSAKLLHLVWAEQGAPLPENFDLQPRATIPYLDEPWYY